MKTAIRVLILSMVAVYAASLNAADHDWYPDGLSIEHRAKFSEYQDKVVAAIHESRLNEDPVNELPERFPIDKLVPILKQVFGDDWSPIQAYADKKLSELPEAENIHQLSQEPIYLRVAREEELNLYGSLSKVRPFEEGAAVMGIWDPHLVAEAMEGAVVGLAGPDILARHYAQSRFLPKRLVRTQWRGENALAMYAGEWIVIFNYIRSPRGLIAATNMALFER